MDDWGTGSRCEHLLRQQFYTHVIRKSLVTAVTRHGEFSDPLGGFWVFSLASAKDVCVILAGQRLRPCPQRITDVVGWLFRFCFENCSSLMLMTVRDSTSSRAHHLSLDRFPPPTPISSSLTVFHA